MLGIDLTEKENKIWVDVGERLAAGLSIRHLALQYYIQYRENLQQQKLYSDTDERIGNLMQIAYFISQKNQVTFNLRGERVTGVALSINEIIKKNNDFEDFIYHMKEMLKVITIEEKTVEQEIQTCLKKFKFTMTFYHKFISTFKKIVPAPSDASLMQSLLWLVFIICKQKLKDETDLISSTCIIAWTFIYYIRESIFIKKIDFQLKDQHYGGILNKDTVEHVFLEYFRLKDMSKYEQIGIFFHQKIQQTKTKTNCDHLFSEKTLEQAYRKVDSLYQKRLNENNIDERHFLKERINTIINANRFTPFGGRRAVNQAKNTFAPNQILSHRVLQYDQVEKQVDYDPESEAIKENREKTGISFLKNLIGGKTPTKTPLIKATPMTNAMQMYNWVLEKTSYHKFNVQDFPEQLCKQQKNLKLINGLWKDICAFESEKNEITQNNKQALLALSTEIVYFVTNQHGSFQHIVSLLALNWLTVWTNIDIFLKYDMRMPTSIKVHLLSLETSMISKRLWDSQNCSSAFQTKPDSGDLERLYKRVIHEIVYQIYFISKKLEIKQASMNAIFLLNQYAIGEYADLLYKKSLYQLVICSCYAISRAQGINLKFHQILSAFRGLNNTSKQDYEELTEQIYIDEETNTDIINFYNTIFIKKTKQFLMQIKNDNTGMTDITNKKKIINSPVKELLSKNLLALSDKSRSPLQTPFSQALMAYNESPLLKEKRIKNLASCIDGKRLLEKKESMSKNEAIKQATTLINKKWRTCKSPQGNLSDTVRKYES